MFFEVPFEQYFKSDKRYSFKNCIISFCGNYVKVGWDGYRNVWEICKRILDKENQNDRTTRKTC